MDVQEVEVTIEKNGQVRIHVRGVKGQACLDLTRDLEAALGGMVVDREMTPEALDATETIQQDQRLHNRL
ncbi:MAG: DUF2997 domain-containing protein [Chloroflexi bacterium]|nr:DUF2997 domain-containing protein [Anaerolineaceae bacterium]NMB90158.1 DUF2997 domain-containing protein [Chloroflexota bacterium]